jgi:hypothetical protein
VVSIADSARITLTHRPDDLDQFRFASQAWELWQSITKSRIANPAQFRAREHDGQPGWVWTDGSLRQACLRLFGPNGNNDVFRHGISRWWNETGNAHNLSEVRANPMWWFRDEWADVRPESLRARTGQAAYQARRDRQAAARHPGGGHTSEPKATARHTSTQCRWCEAVYENLSIAAAHERLHHREDYVRTAGYICPVGAEDGGGICGEPFNHAKAIGRHLAVHHGMPAKADRDRTAARAQAQARQQRHTPSGADSTEPAPVTGPAGQPAAGPVAPPRPVLTAVPDFGAAQRSAPGTHDEDSPAAPPATEPAPAVPAAAPPAVTTAAETPGTGLDDVLAAHALIGDYLKGGATREQELLRRAVTAESKLALIAGPLNQVFDAITSG